MKHIIKELLSENGSISMMRVMSLTVMLVGCFIAIKDGESSIGIVSVLLGTAFTGKVVQKGIEHKDDVK